MTKTRRFVGAWRSGEINSIGDCPAPARPARPDKPDLKAQKEMPRRRPKGKSGRFAFVHAIAHLEFNAIDLAWDIVIRFTDDAMPRAFFDDWTGVALDEAEHFSLLVGRMAELGGAYGDLPAHDGLWDAATSTDDDLLARLAIVPMILEARGLDTTPGAVAKLRQAGDLETARIIEIIAAEEIPHVRAGVQWFETLCKRRGLNPQAAFHNFVDTRFSGTPKPPFNTQARTMAGMSADYYHRYTGN